MQNDSIETLLLRHYGNTANTPTGLEARLSASVGQEAETLRQLERTASNLRHKPIGRRRAVRIVTGFDLLSAALKGVQALETSLVRQDPSQPVYP
ncbi:MAG TPA: hypothetical protein VKR42_05720 [Ktedonobacteraceae bacterium]|nr:hypothetical protein [Ktedonobacteraceae bacterium]